MSQLGKGVHKVKKMKEIIQFVPPRKNRWPKIPSMQGDVYENVGNEKWCTDYRIVSFKTKRL